MPRDRVSRFHALLRCFLPRGFREAHAAEMEGVFRERLREARNRRSTRRGAALAVWMREGWDLAATGARLRMNDIGHPTPGGRGMGGWADDLKSALRSLRRSPGFAAFAVVTLALGVGATITFGSFFDRIVLRPVDFPHGDRLVMAWRWREAGHIMISPDLATRDRVRRADVFSGVAGVGTHDVAWSTEDGPHMLGAVFMDAALPALAGLPPVLGRYFDPDDLAGSGAPVVLLSEGLWKRAFGAGPAILGRSIRIDGKPRTIIGVAPEALQPPGPRDDAVDVWLPLPADGSEAGVNVYARLRDGVTLDHARDEMKSLDLAAAESEKSGWSTRLVPVSEMATARVMNPLKVAGTAVALLLLIACINVANLLLARSDARVRDTAVRAAVGASRWRLAREILLESALVALAAAAVGLALAAGAVHAVVALRPPEWTLLGSLHLDPAVTTVAVVCATLTVMVFGALPLIHRIRTRPGAVLTERSATADRNTLALRRFLLVGEVALSFALLVGGVQVVSTLLRLDARDPGLAMHQLLALRVELPAWRFPDDVSREAALQRIRERVAGLPGVRSVAVASGAPPHTGIYFGTAEAEGHPVPEGTRGNAIFFGISVSPGYFHTVGQALLGGRTYTAEDMKADPAPWILGESAARKYFPDGNAVGSRFRLGSNGAWHTIIGVVHDVWANGSATDPGYPQLYPLRSLGEGSTLLVRTDHPATVASTVVPLVHDVDNEIPVLDVQPVAVAYRRALARERLIALLLAAFAVTAGALAAVGLYGVTSQLAVRRTREFGIRISLGAERPAILRLAMRGGVMPVVAGLSLGAGMAWAGLHFVQVGVAGLSAADPLAFTGAGLLLALAAFAAIGVPAVRASHTDPVEAVRAE